MVEEMAKGEEALVEVKEKEEEEATVADSEEEIQFSLERCTRNQNSNTAGHLVATQQ